MTGIAHTLRIGFGFLALLSGAASFGIGAVGLWQARSQDARIAALASGQNIAVLASAPDLVRVAQGRSLISHGNLEAAQALADRMAADAADMPRAELLYALGNAQLRRGLLLLKTVPYRKAAPALSLARADYRQALRLDPDNWDARYNYALVAPLLRDAEAAVPTAGDQMAHERAAWPDIPGAPNGMP